MEEKIQEAKIPDVIIEAIWNRSRKNNNSSQYEDGF